METDRVELLEPGIALPPFEPVEIEDFGLENNANDDGIKAEIEELKKSNETGNEDETNDNSNDDSGKKQR